MSSLEDVDEVQCKEIVAAAGDRGIRGQAEALACSCPSCTHNCSSDLLIQLGSCCSSVKA